MGVVLVAEIRMEVLGLEILTEILDSVADMDQVSAGLAVTEAEIPLDGNQHLQVGRVDNRLVDTDRVVFRVQIMDLQMRAGVNQFRQDGNQVAEILEHRIMARQMRVGVSQFHPGGQILAAAADMARDRQIREIRVGGKLKY